MNIIWSFTISFTGSVLAILVSLFIDRRRMPNLKIVATEEANADNIYPGRGKWKFFRVQVINKSFPKIFGWIPRQTAENCRPKLEFFDERKNPLFGFTGRWSSTPELPQIQHDLMVKLLYPDPVTIPVNEGEFLDVIVKPDKEVEAYGWNNEAYLFDWKPPQYKLNAGSYMVKVTINTQNGVSFTRWFRLMVGDDIDATSLQNDN